MLGYSKKSSTFASAIQFQGWNDGKKIGVWCNGNTADSGPAFPGSSPGTPTQNFLFSEEVFLWPHPSPPQ